MRLNNNLEIKVGFINKAVFMERYRRRVGSAAIERINSILGKRSSSDRIQPPSSIEHSHDEDREKVTDICSITKQIEDATVSPASLHNHRHLLFKPSKHCDTCLGQFQAYRACKTFDETLMVHTVFG